MLSFLNRLPGAILGLIRGAQAPRLRSEVGDYRGPMVWVGGDTRPMPRWYEARLLVYNDGLRRFTVNEAGWLGKDGERLVGWPTEPQPVEPGAAEVVWTSGVDAVVEFHEQHGGIVRMYAHLAGNAKPTTAKVRKDWYPSVQEGAAKQTR